MIEKDISAGPVVDDQGSLVGLLTESDIMWKGAGGLYWAIDFDIGWDDSQAPECPAWIQVPPWTTTWCLRRSSGRLTCSSF